ncbi:unnamed protein product [Psylliodes chrysocephalus]|uniref:Uncharacterized protein n=1 Tax=Psylliodes chrysocephalus TaxID=3402493 RepID=A0A9P0GL74_9CUCU|nr:unnamed protein product [Psylliodes chrysocephala]
MFSLLFFVRQMREYGTTSSSDPIVLYSWVLLVLDREGNFFTRYWFFFLERLILTGIEPFDSEIFFELDFAPSKTTDATTSNKLQFDLPLSSQSTADIINDEEIQEIMQTPPSTEIVEKMKEDCNLYEVHSSTSCTIPTKQFYSTRLPPLPVAEVRTKRKRAKLPSLVISSTPVKTVLETKKQEKQD